MRRQRLFTLVFAVCCLLVLASLSASLDSTVSTTPDDVIDLDYGSLPLTVQDAAELRETYESGQPDQEGETSETRRTDADSRDANAERSSAENEAEQAGGSTSQSDSGSGPTEREGLLAMLWRLLQTLLASLPALVLIGTVALAAHQRDRLLAWLEARLHGRRSTDADSTDTAPAPSFRPPTNRIERAWLEMLSESDVDPDPSATPQECAEQLVRAGLDRDAVWELTAMFEEVRYDETPATADRVHRALHCLRRSRRQEVAE